MNVLLIGSGGREHALAWRISQSKLLTKLFIAPGNGGTRNHGENVNIGINDFDGIANFCLQNNITMIVVGPEEPLVNGIWDYFHQNEKLRHISVIGPSKEGAQLEGSKHFAKEFMINNNIPTARFKTFDTLNIDSAKEFLQTLQAPFVLKADGLAAGKGVLILDSMEEALNELQLMIQQNKFGNAGTTVVIEEFLPGIELSMFVFTNGVDYIILPEAKDYKRIGDNDTGLNTGGMGAVSPVPFANNEFKNKVEQQIIVPTIKGLQKEKINYCGFVFIGLMNVKDNPYVIEYNVRMGDPETEVVMPRITSDLLAMFVAATNNTLKEYELTIDANYATTVMMVSQGYPEDYEKGKLITGNTTGEGIFHAGTAIKEGNLITNGGRVIAATGMAPTLQAALQLSYEAVDSIQYENKYYRKDIGQDLMGFLK
ncbi:MAG TPA: phosphoribosylamine--glycine ligase [Bacteroidia bacterium]|nr:phosphoribosylamine--glycine ligase [Bacteroidia bacterium]